MTAQRAKFLGAKYLGATILTAGTGALLLAGAPASAQVDQAIVLNIMRECAKIDDPTARLACYDNNIRNAGAPARAALPGQMAVPQGGRGAPIASNSPQGFGYESVRVPQPGSAARTQGSQLDEISTQVTSIASRGQGIYAFALEGGAQWEFAESVETAYRLPRSGSTVKIERGALGGFLMYFDDQKAIRVRRVR
ncbi:MAG: hypothetical protein ABIT16_11270 [Croceibacterium sp.]